MKTYTKPELKELVLAPQETVADLGLGGNGSEIIVDGDNLWG